MNIRYKMRPRCNPQNDYLEINSDLKYNQYGEAVVGNVFNTDGTIKVEIYLSDYLINKTNHRFMYFCVNEKNYLTDSYIVINKYFYDNLIDNSFLWTLIWHEIGHFHSLPFVLDNSKVSVYEQRMENILAGKIMIDEQLADLFAVYARGKDEFIKALKWGRAGVKNLPPSFNTDLAIREYNNRIRYIKQIDEKNAIDIFNELLEEHRIRD